MIGKFCFRSQNAIPEFLSTHPSDVTRINQIEAWIPQAMKFYHPEASMPVSPQRSPYDLTPGSVPKT
jgi:predicted Zn-dependent protease